MFLKKFAMFFVNKKRCLNSNVPISKLCTWQVGRTLILLLDWCNKMPQMTIIISSTKVTGSALYKHACYNIEILIKLLTFFIERLQTFFIFFLSFLNVF